VRARARGNVPVRRAPLAEVFHPLQDSFWGERHGQVIDPFGHRWVWPSICAMSRTRS
jgi:hypothetical protein